MIKKVTWHFVEQLVLSLLGKSALHNNPPIKVIKQAPKQLNNITLWEYKKNAVNINTYRTVITSQKCHIIEIFINWNKF